MGRVLDPSHEILVDPGDGRLRSVGCCVIASTLLAKVRGLIGTVRPQAGVGMLLEECRSVHTFFMAYPIDVYFLGHPEAGGRVSDILRQDRRLGKQSGDSTRRFVVLGAVYGLRPFRFPVADRRARAVLELASEPSATSPSVRISPKEQLIVRPLGIGTTPSESRDLPPGIVTSRPRAGDTEESR